MVELLTLPSSQATAARVVELRARVARGEEAAEAARAGTEALIRRYEAGPLRLTREEVPCWSCFIPLVVLVASLMWFLFQVSRLAERLARSDVGLAEVRTSLDRHVAQQQALQQQQQAREARAAREQAPASPPGGVVAAEEASARSDLSRLYRKYAAPAAAAAAGAGSSGAGSSEAGSSETAPAGQPAGDAAGLVEALAKRVGDLESAVRLQRTTTGTPLVRRRSFATPEKP